MAVRRLSFPDAALPARTEELRHEVRSFLQAELAAGSFTPSCDTWLSGHDPQFSQRLGKAGFLGLTFPAEYGGHARSALDRFVVVEELLAHGAPVAAHWIADRQSGPSILKHGNTDMKAEIIPGIARGEVYFSIGMSEPDAGSDLANIRSTGVKVEGGYRLNGTKIWTSQAHNNQYFIVLVRTTPAGETGGDRHAGMTQFVMDLRSPGVEIRPIRLLSGHHHFNEVVMSDVFVPDHMVLGTEGNGWAQVIGELAFERSGPERYLSTFPLLAALVDALGPEPDPAAAAALALLVGRLAALRRLCISVAVALDAGRTPVTEAAAVKDMGTRLEQEIGEVARWLVPFGSDERFDQLVADAVLSAPGFTLRGGTNEILRGIVARELGVR
ncbi:MAG: acyl-CoA dehydrogenase family protein [Acidimicrobiales bacterium]